MAKGPKSAGEAAVEGSVFRASHRMARVSPRKARLVMDLIRDESVERALVKLSFCERRSAPMIRKVLESAVANATQEEGLSPAELRVHRAFVDEGPTLKRWRPRSMGRAYPRMKRTSHLNVVVCRTEEPPSPAAGARASGQGATAGSGE